MPQLSCENWSYSFYTTISRIWALVVDSRNMFLSGTYDIKGQISLNIIAISEFHQHKLRFVYFNVRKMTPTLNRHSSTSLTIDNGLAMLPWQHTYIGTILVRYQQPICRYRLGIGSRYSIDVKIENRLDIAAISAAYYVFGRICVILGKASYIK